MVPITAPPNSVKAFLRNYRDVFCRDEGFEWISRYVTGLLISPNKTLQGMYDLQVFPEGQPHPSRRAMHNAVFEAGWQDDRLIARHCEVIAPDYRGRGRGRVVMSLDWTYAHHERDDHIHGVKKRYDYVHKRMSRDQTVLTVVVANRARFDGVDARVQPPSFEPEEKAYLEATAQVPFGTREAGIQRAVHRSAVVSSASENV